jgi:DNA-binding response OmpR family regulator
MAKILVADDDRVIAEQVSQWLCRADGHVVETVADGQEALDRLKFYDYDLLVLDWKMPGLTGVDVCREFRARRGNLPILIMTSNASISDKATGFDAGADDYLTKPFDLKELSLRIRALLRRPAEVKPEEYRIGNVRLDAQSRQVFKNDRIVSIPRREYDLLELLMKNAGRFLSAEEIANKLWSSESDVSPLAIKTVMSRLKSKLWDAGEKSFILNAHGRGYCAMTEEQEPE